MNNLILIFLKIWPSTIKAIIRKLLEIQDNDGDTLLHWASRKGHKSIVNNMLSAFVGDTEKLLELLKIKGKWGYTLLHWAAENGHEATVNIILSAFVGDTEKLLELLKIQDNDGYTLLHRAAKNGHAETLKMIINKLSPTEALELLHMTNTKGRNVYDDSKSEIKSLLNSFGANPTSNYFYVNDQSNIENSNKMFDAAPHIVSETDNLKPRIPEKYHHKVIHLTTKDTIEKAIEKAIEKGFEDHPISKAVYNSTNLIADIIPIITKYAITTVEMLRLMESLRRVPYSGGGIIYHELLGSAARLSARLLVKNPCFNFRAIKFTGDHNDNKILISFVEQMLANDYKLNINGKEFNLNNIFNKMYNGSNISKNSVDKILSEITEHSFEVKAMPASELANSPEAKEIPGDSAGNAAAPKLDRWHNLTK